MKKVDIIEEYNTSLGKTFIIKAIEIKKGEMIKAKNKIYVVKSVILPTNPAQGDEKISIVVE